MLAAQLENLYSLDMLLTTGVRSYSTSGDNSFDMLARLATQPAGKALLSLDNPNNLSTPS